jgi:Domain of unknown function (DUF4440)
MPKSPERSVERLERRRVQAMLAADVGTLDRILDDDLTYTHVTGRTQGKAEYLEALRNGSFRYLSLARAHVRIRVYEQTAVLTGEANGVVLSRGRRFEVPLVFTSVYAKRGARWRMVAWQATERAWRSPRARRGIRRTAARTAARAARPRRRAPA